MNANPLVLLMLAYIAFFGVSVNLKEDTHVPAMAKCKPIPAPTLQTPPTIPIIDKANLENKDYVIRVLIKHIQKQNTFIDNSNKEVTKIYNSYTSCTVK